LTLVSQYRPIILDATNASDTKVLRDYAEFWKIPWQTKAEPHEQQTIFSTGRTVSQIRDGRVIVSPAGREGAEKIAIDYGLALDSKDQLISLPAGRHVEVSLRTEIYEFSGPNLDPILTSGDISILSRIHETEIYLLAVDIVGEYSRRISGGFEDKPSKRFWLATKLPFSYQSIPQFIRDRSFRSSKAAGKITEEKLGPVECLRTVFLASLVLSSGPIPRIAFWKSGKSYALAVTHDVETQTGLEMGAPRLIAVERNLGIRSTWNVPSSRYPLPPGSLDRLTEAGEVGAHDTVHDGRLIFLNSDEKVERLKVCKQRLEKLTGREVRGFRSPLLQHNADLASATAKAGYAHDSSCPSWEILSPTSLSAHGVGTVFPFETSDTLEIPVSLPQDHQLIRVAGLKPPAAVDLLLRLSKWIRGFGGPCILLVHPDYELATGENVEEYQRLLENFASDPQCDIMTLSQIADWWKHRERAHWESKDGQLTIVSSDPDTRPADFQAEVVTGYGSNGFTSEILS
jgi:peptidoglycan/xylan/chitin deacetylase (PgdA/CDA1 family)